MSDAATFVCAGCGAVNRAGMDKLAAGARPDCGKCGAPLFAGHPIEAKSDADFDKHVARTGVPVLVDFWAAWCGPCRMMAPHFESAAARFEPNVRLLKVDTEKLQQTAAKFGIRSIPTLMLFRDGREIARQPGAMDAAGIERWVAQHI